MDKRMRDVSRESWTSPVVGKKAHGGVRTRMTRSKIFRGGTVVLGIGTVYVLTATLTSMASGPGHPNANLSTSKHPTIQEQVMNESDNTTHPNTQSSHHVSLNVNQNSNTSSSTATVDSSSSSTNASATSTDVVVNGEHVAVPQNGSVHKTIPSSDGNANVDINVNSSGNGTTSSSSSVDVNISSNSQSTNDSGGQ